MSLRLGRLLLDDPDTLEEAIGDAIDTVGSVAVQGSRQGQRFTLSIATFAPTSEAVADRMTVRRQLRSMVNNVPLVLRGLYMAWDQDAEQNGWYVLHPGSLTPNDQASLANGWFKTQLGMQLRGHRRTHRPAAEVILRDRRLGTTPRDYLGRVYSTDFSAMSTYTLTWLPSAISDAQGAGQLTPTLTSARSGYGGASVKGAIGATDGDVITFEQTEAADLLGNVVIYDRRGSLTTPSTGPDDDWQEVYGPDWESSGWTAATDTPLLDNSLCRVSYSSANTDGFTIERWVSSAWVTVGKVLIERKGDSTAWLDTLVSASVAEWTPERAVVKVVMRASGDGYSREEIYITLQRGWNGPRFEVYPSQKSGPAVSGASIAFYRTDAPAGTETANKWDASLQTTTGSPNFTPGAVGAATFSGENWIMMRRSGLVAVTLAGLQAGASGRVEYDTAAYGANRNGIKIVSTASAGYVSAHMGMSDESGTNAISSVSGLADGARELGKAVLFESRAPQQIVTRAG